VDTVRGSGLLFVIASSNVANLVLARTVRREPELAIRSALGASTAVLRRSLLAEEPGAMRQRGAGGSGSRHTDGGRAGSLCIALLVRANDLTLDFSLVWFGIGLALIAAVFLAFIPRLPSANAPQGGLTGRGTRVAGGSSRRLRIFAVTQIAASFLLLAGACVLMKTLFVLEQTRPPFDSANVLAVNLPLMSYGKRPSRWMSSIARCNAASARCREWSTCLRVSALPGVTIQA
jgi:putative ABC transport system permease protein